ncbi:hypothetical protein [Nannocystis pusilla]|uniref:Uncharacterized protein n=1 Tax=Nannocystis pusilla TaxID=889268 RepID=A0ABS7TLA9_9BACT|nr:hypothetical protein [Nannocystis pusilla]MBZ5708984.1 hypothetical protein [Nannocystis pusilla]
MTQPGPPLLKFRYEYPPGEAHFLEAPSAEAAVRFLRRTYPHNPVDVLPTLREISRWPAFWKTVDAQGLVVPDSARPRS